MRTTWMKRLIVATGSAATLLTLAAVPTDAEAGWLDKLLDKLRDRNRPYHDRAVPEIDPNVVAGAIALVSGGIAILRDRRRRD
jgi:hypothetical protein